MLNFTFHNPTKIVFGTETIPRLAKLVPAAARVLILSGGGSAEKNGTLPEVRAALAGKTVFEFSGIEPNPSIETLMQAVALVRQHEVDFLLAVGGGSVIDGTKFVAAAACYDGEPWEILTAHGRNVAKALPLASVLTLPATGSEMNNGGVITRLATQEKLAFSSPLLYPVFSILDPTKTYSLPLRQIANGIVDAFVHVAEQYLTYPAGAMVQDRFAEGLLRTLVDVAPQVMSTEKDYDAYANFVWAATMALNGLIGAGVPQDWATHMIGHELTALHGIDHGRTLAAVLPALLAERREQKRDKLLQYAERVWDIRDGTEDARIDAAIAKTREFFESVGVGTRLADYSLGEADIEPIVRQLEAHGMTQLGENRDITPEASRRILLRAL